MTKISFAHLRRPQLRRTLAARDFLPGRTACTVIGLVAGLSVILTLWRYNPVLALLCIPMVASVLTALALMVALPGRNRRHRVR
jgi:ABC-type bacteriocin/lantibiotic exporter with double-glycine peptidase domain